MLLFTYIFDDIIKYCIIFNKEEITVRDFYKKSSFCSTGAFCAAANCCAVKNISLLDTAAIAVSVFLSRISKLILVKITDVVKITGIITDILQVNMRSRVESNLSVPI